MDSSASRYVLVVRPRVEQQGDQSWKAWYPKSDWHVMADTKDNAAQKLRDEFERRLNAGEVDTEPEESLLERHLTDPIPGVYAIDRDVYMRMRTGPNFRSDLDALIARIDGEH
ncbi:hypothetical protein [Mycobacterium intracellulare]|uniref:Uncharacterized protein n=1 Tax=Mycobacterium intracellulare TaxID=1767 RepID=A0A7R7MSQ7_MYCIT|nr:hypothetical protein [Mycobacterium intracellulare]BCO99326.1 hypothetical protein MINTM018_20960 [Mycobacterium intracellulare]